jgi:hypothetical protein
MSRQSDAGRNIPFLDKEKPGNSDLNASLEASDLRRVVVTADDAEVAGLNIIPAGAFRVKVAGVTNDANDFVVLPSLANVPDGHEITLLCSAGANFELRTPAASAEEINSEDCDGTKEYLCTDTQIVKVIKINDTIGWMAHGYTAIGAVAAAVIPD